MPYTPPQVILEKYADLLINFALGDGKGVQPGETVWMRLHESAKPMYVPLRNAIIKAGGNPIIQYMADGVGAADVYELSSDTQLSFFPEKFYKGLVDQIDHMVYLISEYDKFELQSADPKKMMQAQRALMPYMEW